jgi:protein-S-isoprenylcysteine O-methyltransferase Ste14
VNNILIYNLTQLSALAAFSFLIWPFRKPKCSTRLLHPAWIAGLRLSFTILLVVYTKALFSQNEITPMAFLGLLLTASGLLVVAVAKSTLARNHAPAGFFLKTGALVQRGVYGRLRHPLYAGIFLYILGGILVSLPNLPPTWTTVGLLACCQITTTLLLAAAREEQALATRFPKKFSEYRKTVPAAIPKLNN